MHTLMLRSQNNYVTPVLVLLMLAAVCQFSSRYLTRTNTNCAVGGFCVDNSIDSGIHGLCPTRQDRVVRYVRFVPLLLTYSNKGFHVLKDLGQHVCGYRYRHCSWASLAIKSDRVILQSYSEVSRFFHCC